MSFSSLYICLFFRTSEETYKTHEFVIAPTTPPHPFYDELPDNSSSSSHSSASQLCFTFFLSPFPLTTLASLGLLARLLSLPIVVGGYQIKFTFLVAHQECQKSVDQLCSKLKTNISGLQSQQLSDWLKLSCNGCHLLCRVDRHWHMWEWGKVRWTGWS